MKKPLCQMCGGATKPAKKSSGNAIGIALALIVFTIGVVVTLAIPLLGWVIGPIICVCALFMGGKTHKVWLCQDRACKFAMPRH